jgi:uncharacterized protein YdaU (DUF1376 family)
MAALPYMPLYAADYLADTAHLTTAQHGAYLLLLMNYWQRGGPLPDDDTRLARIARVGPREWAKMRGTISEFFSIADGNWSHNRVDSELARVESKSLKSKRAAQASVQRRFGSRKADAEPTDTEADTSKTEPKGSPNKRRPIPDDWQPREFAAGSESRKVIDSWPPGERDAQFEQFMAHHRSKRNTFLDPQDAWSTWVLNTRKWGIGRHERSERDPTTVALERLIGPHAGTG